MILCAAIITDFIPEAHTLFTVVVGVVMGRPVREEQTRCIFDDNRLMFIVVVAHWALGHDVCLKRVCQ